MRTIDICRDAEGLLRVRTTFDDHPMLLEHREGEDFTRGMGE